MRRPILLPPVATGTMMAGDLVYVVHPESSVAAKLRGGLQDADYQVVAMSTVDDAESITIQKPVHSSGRHSDSSWRWRRR